MDKVLSKCSPKSNVMNKDEYNKWDKTRYLKEAKATVIQELTNNKKYYKEFMEDLGKALKAHYVR